MLMLAASRTDAGDARSQAPERPGHASHRLTGLYRVCIAIALLAIPLITTPATAQDCSFTGDEWDNIQFFRRCLEEGGPDQWNAPSGNTMLHYAAYETSNPTIVYLLLEAGFDPDARNDLGRTPLHRSALNANPMVTRHLEPNAFGLYDMLGNVSEWTGDCWNERYLRAPIGGGEWLSGDCSRRVTRGGSWINRPGNLRSANRYPIAADMADRSVGFRVARTLRSRPGGR